MTPENPRPRFYRLILDLVRSRAVEADRSVVVPAESLAIGRLVDSLRLLPVSQVNIPRVGGEGKIPVFVVGDRPYQVDQVRRQRLAMGTKRGAIGAWQFGIMSGSERVAVVQIQRPVRMFGEICYIFGLTASGDRQEEKREVNLPPGQQVAGYIFLPGRVRVNIGGDEWRSGLVCRSAELDNKIAPIETKMV